MAINLCDPENLACQVTTTAWDCCHKVSETEPDGSTTTWDYDDEGRMITSLRLIPLDMTNVAWLATCYEHDDLGRKTYEGGATYPVRYTYDIFGGQKGQHIDTPPLRGGTESVKH